MKNHYLNPTNPFRVVFYIGICCLFSACSIDTSNFTFDETEMNGVKAVQQYLPGVALSIKKGVSVKTGSGKVKTYILSVSYTDNPSQIETLEQSSALAWVIYEQLNDSLRQKYDAIETKVSGANLSYKQTYSMETLAKVQKCMGNAKLFTQGFIDANSQLIEQSFGGNEDKIREIAYELTKGDMWAGLKADWGEVDRQKLASFSTPNDSSLVISFRLHWNKEPFDTYHRVDLTHDTESGKITNIDL